MNTRYPTFLEQKTTRDSEQTTSYFDKGGLEQPIIKISYFGKHIPPTVELMSRKEYQTECGYVEVTDD